MKKIVIFLIIAIIFKIELYAQTSEPTQIGLNVINYSTNDLYYIIDHQDDFTLNAPMLGWMWNSRPAITAMVLANQSHITGQDEFTRYENAPVDNTIPNLINVPNLMTMSNHYIKNNTNYYRHLNTDHNKIENDGLLLARALHLDPAINLNPILNVPYQEVDYYKIARQCNSEDNSSVFGFGFRDSNNFVINRTNNYIQLPKISYSSTYALVLKDPWKLNILDVGFGEYDQNIIGKREQDKIQNYNGNKYYLSVNVKRLSTDCIGSGNESGNEPVLKIIMKYKYNDNINDYYKVGSKNSFIYSYF